MSTLRSRRESAPLMSPLRRFKPVGWKTDRIGVLPFSNRTGTITRGMLVQDHRQSSQSATSMTAQTGLTNRAEAIEALDIAEVESHRAEGDETRAEADLRRRRSGARVVCKAPTNERLQRDLVKSIWGVDV